MAQPDRRVNEECQDQLVQMVRTAGLVQQEQLEQLDNYSAEDVDRLW